ncbi:MAG: DUF2461 domain-containing protein [Microscillaceae bacterium]|nr:DUF2461 domain-containing protein [Microscillaceae bacterium]
MKTTLDFLQDLSQHNHREWFAENKSRYESAKAEFIPFIDQMIREIGLFDADIAPLEAKQCIFRINRDIRFSKDKSPYKTNMGGFLGRGGRQTRYAGYYIHLQPKGESFFGGGLYMPPAPDLSAVRQEIDYHIEEFLGIVQAEDFQTQFGEIQGERVKTAPKGYAKDHPYLPWLQYKSYAVWSNFSDEQVQAGDFLEKVVQAARTLHPLVVFLNRALGD